MTERPNVHAENLLSAAKRYGDACVAWDRVTRGACTHQEANAALEESTEAERQLHRVARAYATRMRRKKTSP